MLITLPPFLPSRTYSICQLEAGSEQTGEDPFYAGEDLLLALLDPPGLESRPTFSALLGLGFLAMFRRNRPIRVEARVSPALIDRRGGSLWVMEFSVGVNSGLLDPKGPVWTVARVLDELRREVGLGRL